MHANGADAGGQEDMRNDAAEVDERNGQKAQGAKDYHKGKREPGVRCIFHEASDCSDYGKTLSLMIHRFPGIGSLHFAWRGAMQSAVPCADDGNGGSVVAHGK
nr:hypothetical protein [Halomonas elongata]